ncbi:MULTISPECIES: flagellar biosynthetic protein FliO [unclassified Massilia]|uniref:flagellar biosynthetic protein FliO n=1 Tax=unclassified Massilia TaxID=2609279 RepID=UPI000B02681F|nr:MULTISPECIES: flagellar biosynthetic protein FliO [unclassified Massilia]
MTTTARLLTILAITLPLAACAAQPAAHSQDQVGQAGGAAAAPAAAAAAQSSAMPSSTATAPAMAPQPQSSDNARTQTATPAAQPRRSAGAVGAPLAGTSASPAPAASAPATEPSAVPAANAPAMNPASPDAPETTVGGGAANRVPASPAAGPVTMPSGSATGSLLQTLLALIVVLAVLGALAWFLKRYGPKAGGGSANLRVVGALNLGGRERVLVVEVGNQWIVVGASPGRINALATMPKQDGVDTGAGEGHATLAPHGANAAQPANSFADWLKQTIDKRK